jgi:hypothetical protein
MYGEERGEPPRVRSTPLFVAHRDGLRAAEK